MTTTGLNEANKNFLISKQLVNPNDNVIKTMIKTYIDDIDKQLIGSGNRRAYIKSYNDDDMVEIGKDEVKQLLGKHVEQAYSLTNAILNEQGIKINDLTIVNYCSFSYKSLIGEMLRKYFSGAKSSMFHGDEELSVLNGIGLLVSFFF